MTNVIVLAYQRPSLMIDRCTEVIEWPSLNRLIISIDGPRENATIQELAWRDECIVEARRFAAIYRCKVSVCILNENLGLTSHVLEALNNSFADSESTILLEEDTSLEHSGLNFLAGLGRTFEPAVRAGYTRAFHKGVNQVERVSFFPEQWGLSMNRSFFEAFRRVCREESVEEPLVEAHIRRLLGPSKRVLIGRATRYWSRLFRDAFQNPNHTDALFLYTAISLGLVYTTPWTSFTRDVGHLDGRGMHKRTKADLRFVSHFQTGSRLELCMKCEARNMNLRVMRGPRYWYERAYRLVINR